jgi:hypothetical protein
MGKENVEMVISAPSAGRLHIRAIISCIGPERFHVH